MQTFAYTWSRFVRVQQKRRYFKCSKIFSDSNRIRWIKITTCMIVIKRSFFILKVSSLSKRCLKIYQDCGTSSRWRTFVAVQGKREKAHTRTRIHHHQWVSSWTVRALVYARYYRAIISWVNTRWLTYTRTMFDATWYSSTRKLSVLHNLVMVSILCHFISPLNTRLAENLAPKIFALRDIWIFYVLEYYT